MKALKCFFAIISIIFGGSCFAQTGSLHFHFDISVSNYQESYHCFLYSNDSIVRIKTIESFEDWKIDSLVKGLYRIELTGVDGKSIFNESDIIVNNDSITHEDIMLGRSFSRKRAEESANPFELNITCLYGNNKYFEERKPNSYNQTIGLKLGYLGIDAISKHDAICFYLGASGSGTVFDKDTTTYKGVPVQRKWYSGFCVDFALYNRLTFYDCQKYNNKGFFVDAGIGYSLPLYYREIKIIDHQTKVKTKHIHEYSNVYVIGRIGYKGIAITGEYNLSTFLKSVYTEVPTARIGLTFCFPTPD